MRKLLSMIALSVALASSGCGSDAASVNGDKNKDDDQGPTPAEQAETDCLARHPAIPTNDFLDKAKLAKLAEDDPAATDLPACQALEAIPGEHLALLDRLLKAYFPDNFDGDTVVTTLPTPDGFPPSPRLNVALETLRLYHGLSESDRSKFLELVPVVEKLAVAQGVKDRETGKPVFDSVLALLEFNLLSTATTGGTVFHSFWEGKEVTLSTILDSYRFLYLDCAAASDTPFCQADFLAPFSIHSMQILGLITQNDPSRKELVLDLADTSEGSTLALFKAVGSKKNLTGDFRAKVIHDYVGMLRQVATVKMIGQDATSYLGDEEKMKAVLSGLVARDASSVDQALEVKCAPNGGADGFDIDRDACLAALGL